MKTKTENKLVEILKKETESLKNQFLANTKDWSISEFWKTKQWMKDYGDGKFQYTNDYYGKRMRFIDQAKYYKLPRYFFEDNPEKFIEKNLQIANEHYENSIIKLAIRIQKYEMDLDKLEVTTSKIGVNINAILTDGNKTIRAYTILASGEVQKPHYRFLVK